MAIGSRARLRPRDLGRRWYDLGAAEKLLVVVSTLWACLYALVALAAGAGFDSRAYWLTRFGIHYALNPGQHDAYLYSPAFAQAIRPLTALPWPVFAVAWSSVAAAVYLFLARAVPPRWRLPILVLCLGDVIYGNVWWLFVLVLVYGLRRPVLWAIPLLLKITPAVGLVWFAVRREWRSLIVAAGAAVAVAALSAMFAPDAWSSWFTLLRHGRSGSFPDQPVPRAARVLAALALTAYAARRDRPRLLVVALWLATPMLSLNGTAVAIAFWHLPERDARPVT